MHQRDTKSSSWLVFADIKRHTTTDDCSDEKKSVHFTEANLSNINDLVMGYRDSLVAAYQIVSQDQTSNCTNGNDIYDVCGNILPNDTGFISSVCGEGSYCTSGVYGRSLNVNISNLAINDFPVHSVSYLLYGIIISSLNVLLFGHADCLQTVMRST